MSGVISYPSSCQPDSERFYTIHERRPPGPWHTNRLNFSLRDLNEAIKAAKARIHWEPGLIIRILDNTGQECWSNNT